jgi:hypothetical protein
MIDVKSTIRPRIASGPEPVTLVGTACTSDSSSEANNADYLITQTRNKLESCRRVAKTLDVGRKLEYLVDRRQEAQLEGSCLPNNLA